MNDNARVFKGSPEQKIILAANNRRVKHEGNYYLIRAVRIGKNMMGDAEPFPQGGQPINLFGDNKLAKELRKLVEARLFS